MPDVVGWDFLLDHSVQYALVLAVARKMLNLYLAAGFSCASRRRVRVELGNILFWTLILHQVI